MRKSHFSPECVWWLETLIGQSKAKHRVCNVGTHKVWQWNSEREHSAFRAGLGSHMRCVWENTCYTQGKAKLRQLNVGSVKLWHNISKCFSECFCWASVCDIHTQRRNIWECNAEIDNVWQWNSHFSADSSFSLIHTQRRNIASETWEHMNFTTKFRADS